MPRSDEELLTAYIAGEEEAFASLLDRYIKPVYSFALRLVGEQSDAEDISQDTFLKVWKNVKNYKPGSSSFKTWLMHIARNTAIDFLRKRKSVAISQFENEEGENVLLETTADNQPLPDEEFASAAEGHAVTEAIKQLPLLQREVFILHYTNHLTFEEIGGILKESTNTVKSRHRRGLSTLRRILTNHVS